MFFEDPVFEQGFQVDDALILAQPLLLELEGLLPLPASTEFWLPDMTCSPEHTFSSEQREKLHAWQSEMDQKTDCTPAMLEDILVIPLLTTPGERAALVIYDIDPAVLRKMATEWLVELREKILQHFCLIRKIYIEPDTGLYNRRALTLSLSAEPCQQTLFFLAVVPGTRTLASSFQKIRQVSSLLQSLLEEPLFTLGQGLF
ncbi:MAG: hypothetical protein D3910_21065, partial [Candidatus Electrothrix sp. ATG2]|nr:hypothetical protein [Candidatus Electrothrix sp. ATG2]